jgi:hypothetical protein
MFWKLARALRELKPWIAKRVTLAESGPREMLIKRSRRARPVHA